MRNKVTVNMASVIVTALDHGGIMHRHSGNVWSYPGAPAHHFIAQGTTVAGLIARRYATVLESRKVRGELRPIKVLITAEPKP